jgi:hypothetical protein
LDYPRFDLVDLEFNITIDEIKRAISEMPKENTPGPDGFIGAFYSTCLDVIKKDVCQAVWQLSQLRGHNFNLLNTANIVLLLKKEHVESIGDFRPISLVHW